MMIVSRILGTMETTPMHRFFGTLLLRWREILSMTTATMIAFSCGHAPDLSVDSVVSPWTMENYRAFIIKNQHLMDQIYATDYVEYQFIVDTEVGTKKIQQLIDPEAARKLFNNTLFDEFESRQILETARRLLAEKTNYREHPGKWPTISGTLISGEADCKGRSLLLLSLLIAADQKAYAAIGNSHMWVVVWIDGKWEIVETDPDPQRALIYGIPGFYDNPLYKIDANRTVKRKRLDQPIPNEPSDR